MEAGLSSNWKHERGLSLDLDDGLHAKRFCEWCMAEMTLYKMPLPDYEFDQFTEREWKILAQALMQDFVIHLQLSRMTVH